MARVYVGNLDPRVTERDLEDEFRAYGVLRRCFSLPLFSCLADYFAACLCLASNLSILQLVLFPYWLDIVKV